MLKPLGDRVVIKVKKEEEKTEGGLILTASAKEAPQTGEVVAVGTGHMTNNGERIPVDVKVGDVVLFEKYAGTEVKYEGHDYLMMHEKDIMAIMD